MEIINHPSKFKQGLKQFGYTCLPQIFTSTVCQELREHIKYRLQEFIKEHQCSTEDYFSTVNRWPLTALVDDIYQQTLIDNIAVIIKDILQCNVQALEVDILYKSLFANLPTPCHQDIAYAFAKPYAFSTWLPLYDVTIDDSPLQFLPGSHEQSILPAVDFWQPEFIDVMRNSTVWQQKAVAVPLSAGEAILFSSQVWHGSCAHQSNRERVALVIRWECDNFIPSNIPQPEPAKFGMWTCGEYTQKILCKGLQEIFNIEVTSFFYAIQSWQANLSNVPFVCDIEKAKTSLKKLALLNQAYNLYQGGDGQGIVYANLWWNLLKPLNNYLSKKGN